MLEVTVPLKLGRNSDQAVNKKVSIADPVKLIQHMLSVDPKLIYGNYSEDQRVEFWSRSVQL